MDKSNITEYKGRDFYCDMVLSGKVDVKVETETDSILAFHHTRPYWPIHIVVIPKKHISSLITLEESDNDLVIEIMNVVKSYR